jgi:hypothetical protein
MLSGPIPPELGRLTNFELLSLDHNNLSGPIPPELGNLTTLTSLYLHDNMLSGRIPPKLNRLTDLTILSLSDNLLFGPIPHDLSRLTELKYLILSNNRLSGLIPIELGSLPSLELLDLQTNHLVGNIPPELSSLVHLNRLSLADNSLFGLIPPELGDLTKLVQLNLSLTNTTCDGLDCGRLEDLEGLGLPCLPVPSLNDTNIVSVALGYSSEANRNLDLSLLPDSCKVVKLMGSHPNLHSIQFWRGCDDGCILSLVGTGARMLRKTRRDICLNSISVFLSGDVPHLEYEVGSIGSSIYVKNTLIYSNAQGKYNLSDPSFVDRITIRTRMKAAVHQTF